MPPDDGLRLNENEVPSPPTRPQPAQPNPEDAITRSNPKPRLTPEGDLQLMPEGKILERQVTATAEGCAGYAN
jgi:hypothetical protein